MFALVITTHYYISTLIHFCCYLTQNKVVHQPNTHLLKLPHINQNIILNFVHRISYKALLLLSIIRWVSRVSCSAVLSKENLKNVREWMDESIFHTFTPFSLYTLQKTSWRLHNCKFHTFHHDSKSVVTIYIL